MKIDEKLVKDIAQLARLEFSNDELLRFTDDFSKILEYVDAVRELPIEDCEPAVQVFDIELKLREDRAEQSFSQEQALSNAPQKKDGCFIVPRVVANDKT